MLSISQSQTPIFTKNGEAPAAEDLYSNSEAVKRSTAPFVLASIQAQGIKP